jgi:HSP20 family protein
VRSRDFSNWMWGEALSMLDRAQRLHRQFFTHAAVAWEPPVDIVEAGDALQVHVALPGVTADAITVTLDPAGIPAAAKTRRSTASRSPTAGSSATSGCRSAILIRRSSSPPRRSRMACSL